ncbi:MAG: hypothetical protein COA79_09385 [Planctomycetota bacterium]|nr:MAG: hypothetical protein COA79_09385 [Planctomycetota bacterium]
MKLKFVFVVLLLISMSVSSIEPVLYRISPLGGKIGTEVKVTVFGNRLKDFTSLLFSSKKITILKTIKIANNRVELLLKIQDDCKPGLFGFRVVTKSGLSLLKLFSVNHFPVIQNKEPNNSFEKAQVINKTCTIEGVITSEDIDFYAMDVDQGQRISIEIEGIRLGYTFFDSLISIYDHKKQLIKTIDDTLLLKQDPCFSFLAKTKGRYYVSIREAAFRGSKNSRYRMHMGDFPRPLLSYPLSIRSDQETSVKLFNDISKDEQLKTIIKSQASGLVEYIHTDEKNSAPSPVYLHSHALKSYSEVEPNLGMHKPNVITFSLPFTISGIIQEKNDNDWFQFKAKKGQKFDVFVHARKYRSPFDSFISIFDKNKKHINSNDDSGSPDSFLTFSATYDGIYYIQIRDSLQRGAKDFVYHVEFRKRQPIIDTYLAATKVRTQEGQFVDLSAGNKAVLKMSVNRQYNNDELKVSVSGLPDGVTWQASNISSKVKTYPIILINNGSAPLQSGHLKIKLTSVKNNKIMGETKQSVNLVYGFPNNIVYHSYTSKEIPFALTEKAPFSVEIMKPDHPLAQTGSLRLKVKVKREKNCKGEIRIQTVAEIPGVGIGKEIIINKDQDSGTIILSANNIASIGKWPFAVRGVWNAGKDAKKKPLGNKIVGSNIMNINVVPMYVDVTMEMAVVPQGEKISMLCKINHLKPFSGKATLALSGLPNDTKAKKIEFTSQDKDLWVEIQTTKKSRRGRHRSVFCYIEIPFQKGFINQNIGKGTLRVDKPKPKNEGTKKKEKKLSRLNELRQEKSID